MKWVELNKTHINTDQVQTFYWVDREVRIWFAGAQKVTRLPDPDKVLYIKLCRALGVRPVEEADVNGKN